MLAAVRGIKQNGGRAQIPVGFGPPMFHQSGSQTRNSGGDREIVVLRDVEELSSKVTAKRLNATKPVVKIRLFRAGAN